MYQFRLVLHTVRIRSLYQSTFLVDVEWFGSKINGHRITALSESVFFHRGSTTYYCSLVQEFNPCLYIHLRCYYLRSTLLVSLFLWCH